MLLLIQFHSETEFFLHLVVSSFHVVLISSVQLDQTMEIYIQLNMNEEERIQYKYLIYYQSVKRLSMPISMFPAFSFWSDRECDTIWNWNRTNMTVQNAACTL